MSTILLFMLVLAFRIYNALIVRTFFNPDEYWQSLEVAHEVVYGYGYLTWEWEHKIRGFMHPALFVLVYKGLKALKMDQTALFIIAPKVLQALFMATTDIATYLLAKRLYGEGPAKWTLAASLLSFFHFFCGVRTFSNSIEATFTSIALVFWPFQERTNSNLAVALAMAALACLLRPTNVILWIPLGLELLARQKLRDKIQTMALVVCVGGLSVILSMAVDFLFYQELTFTPWNFVLFNLGKDVASFYGTNPWHWYLSQGVPLVFFTWLPFFVLSIFTSKDAPAASMTRTCLISIAIYSLLPHKEFRFIYPLLPMVVALTGRQLYDMRVRWSNKAFMLTMGIFGALNVVAALYLSTVHQRGVVDVMLWLRDQKQQVSGLLFLMPCHSTPLYSYLHANYPIRFLTCEPPIQHDPNLVPYRDEADIFYDDPQHFLETYFDGQASNQTSSLKPSKVPVPGQTYLISKYTWPSHVVFFEPLLEVLEPDLDALGYNQCARFFNSHFHDDSRRKGAVYVYCNRK